MLEAVTLSEAFWQRFDDKVVPEPNTGCWLWTGAAVRRGYGHISLGGRNGSFVMAHRASYERTYGKIPDGMLVCHKCDVPACVNPEHLFIGTHADNMTDRNTKSRQARGVEITNNRRQARVYGATNGQAKLTEADVLAIRADNGSSQRELAKKFGVDQRQISNIRSGRSWKHV